MFDVLLSLDHVFSVIHCSGKAEFHTRCQEEKVLNMNKVIPKITVIAIFVSSLLLAGCAGVGKRLEPPRISLAHIQVQEFTGLEAAGN